MFHSIAMYGVVALPVQGLLYAAVAHESTASAACMSVTDSIKSCAVCSPYTNNNINNNRVYGVAESTAQRTARCDAPSRFYRLCAEVHRPAAKQLP
jgi:hypothetical protein